jgi:hypothetical protein
MKDIEFDFQVFGIIFGHHGIPAALMACKVASMRTG